MPTTVVSSRSTATRVAATARSAQGACHVLDLDGSYQPVGAERVLTPQDVGLDAREVSGRRVLLDVEKLERWAHASLLRHVLSTEPVAIAVRPGVVWLRDPVELAELAAAHQVVVFARGGVAVDGRWPGPADAEKLGSYSPAMVAVSRDAVELLDAWQQLAPDATDRWLDVELGRHPHHVVRDDRLVSAWSASADVRSALAVDLSTLDVAAPWLLDPRATATPRIRLSDDSDLRRLVQAFVDEVGVQVPPASVSSVGIPVQPHLANLVASALAAGQTYESIPDVFDPAQSAELSGWLAEPGSAGGIGRYLAEVYAARADLRAAFPSAVAGRSSELLDWAQSVGLAGVETAPAPKAATVGPRSEGVNVVGYLSGELGIGESARLMLSAIDAGGIAHTTVAVTKHLRSRQTAAYRSASSDQLFDVTLLCVNAKETPSVVASVAAVAKGSYRIGMWYWETEDFPSGQHKGFRHLDEVWVATDYVRAAIEPHSPVPVRTITPPLPQPGAAIDQAAARTRMGLPDRPILLFAFDYASIAERKNPWGLVDAFEQAFAPGERPLLVIKSISGDRNPAQAERLRLRVGDSPDILLVEDYLDAGDRDALMAACDCYISLHRAEGLGLTMAEAMAFGKPVIATAYGGNMQFMTDENSFLVPYSPIAIPEGSGPYSPGAMWADPDLDAAAGLMRTVFGDLSQAAARGNRAADDLRTRHSPEVAGRAIAERLAEIRAGRRSSTPPPVAGRGVRGVARRVLGR
jgi:glycosyltransferase involved in cell wall biosynthesis|nr:glycosyl transferase group 1 [Aeromicrobium sp.]